MTRRLILAAMLVLACGCDSQSAPAASSASAAAASSQAPPPPAPVVSAAPGPRDGPAVLVAHGSDKPIGSAHAFTEGGSAIRIIVSTHQRFCDNVRGKNLKAQSGEMFFGATIVNQLDGKANTRRQRVRDNRFGNRLKSFHSGAGGRVEILEGSPAKGDKLKVKLRTSAYGATLDGVVTATGCGDLVDPHDAVPAVAGVEIAVAGERHVIQSARVMGGKKPALVLSTARLGCKETGPLGDLWLSLQAAADGKGREIILGGDAHHKSRADGDNLAKASISVEQNEVTSDFAFTLAGELQIGDYAVTLDAKGIATNCP